MVDPNFISHNATEGDLSRLAGAYPQLWDQIQAHPNCSAELRAWIAQQHISGPGAVPPLPQGLVPQMATGAGQLGIPARRKDMALMLMQLGIALTAAFGLISLMLPFISALGFSVTLFELAGKVGKSTEIMLLAVSFFAVILFSLLSAFLGRAWSHIVALIFSVVASVSGILTALYCRDNLLEGLGFKDQIQEQIKEVFSVKLLEIGPGLDVLLFSSISMLILGIITGALFTVSVTRSARL